MSRPLDQNTHQDHSGSMSCSLDQNLQPDVDRSMNLVHVLDQNTTKHHRYPGYDPGPNSKKRSHPDDDDPRIWKQPMTTQSSTPPPQPTEPRTSNAPVSINFAERVHLSWNE